MFDLRQSPTTLVTRLEIERHRLLDHGGGFLERLALADAAGEIRHVGGEAAILLRLEDDIVFGMLVVAHPL